MASKEFAPKVTHLLLRYSYVSGDLLIMTPVLWAVHVLARLAFSIINYRNDRMSSKCRHVQVVLNTQNSRPEAGGKHCAL